VPGFGIGSKISIGNNHGNHRPVPGFGIGSKQLCRTKVRPCGSARQMPSGWSTPSVMVDAIGNGRRHSERTTPPMDEPVLSESEGRCPYESAEWKEERSSHPEGRAATSWPCVHDQRKPNTTVPWTSQQGRSVLPDHQAQRIQL
jgi:hypothetical protein